MSSFLAQTVQLPDHALFGVVWDADHNQHLMRLSPAAQLYLTTPDARALYTSLGVSLASRGAITPPADLAGRLEVLARMLRWANQAEFADQVEEILAAVESVGDGGTARFGEPDRLQRAARERGYAGRGENGAAHCDDCARFGHVAAHPDLGCGDVGCVSAHGDDPAPTRPLPVAAVLDGAGR
ncbi:hypothetical protein ACIBCD_27105 [Nocardia brasiliensis]|uniref:hypothetical protein n=1 Tax=Nocardia brasiliensis TaxID=37326 RepID=UPI0037B6F097